MKGLLIALTIAAAIAAGGTAGHFLQPPTAEDAPPGQEQAEAELSGANAATAALSEPMAGPGRTYVEVGKQLIVPIVEGRETRALMMFRFALDVPSEETERVHLAEPKLRDLFLRELFSMSYTGAFMSTYTEPVVAAELRATLARAARSVLGEMVADVLILDIMRQEL